MVKYHINNSLANYTKNSPRFHDLTEEEHIRLYSEVKNATLQDIHDKLVDKAIEGIKIDNNVNSLLLWVLGITDQKPSEFQSIKSEGSMMDKSDKNDIIKLYNDGNSIRKISIDLGIKYYTIYKIIESENIIIRSNKFNSRKFNLDHSYFDNIDSEDKAYFLGLMYADGYVKFDREMFGITLNSRDIDILEKFNKCLNSTYPIRTYNEKKKFGKYEYFIESSRLECTSSNIYINLQKYGVLKSKTNILKPPLFLDKSLNQHFIRGYFDGDGSISFDSGKAKSWRIGFLGTYDILSWINKILINNNVAYSMLKICRKKDSDIVGQISFGGNNQVYNIANWLYKNAKYFLNRKYLKYHEMLSYCSITK